METLTGTVDTDETILLLLPLTDVRHVSLANKYFARLCQSKRLTNKYNNASKKEANTISFLAQGEENRFF
jgi:hypothetical protein